MKQDLLTMLWLSASFLALFGVGEWLYHKFRVQAEWTRKWSHIGTGFFTMLFPLVLHSHLSVATLCGSFLVILTLSKRFGLLPSIHAIDRESYGSHSYPIVVYVCFLAWEKMAAPVSLFYLPVLTMALADPAAAFVGKRWPLGRFRIGADTKTLSGCSGFFAVAFGLALLLFPEENLALGSVVWKSACVALAATLAEALSSKGFDNLSIPLTVLGMLYLFLPYGHSNF